MVLHTDDWFLPATQGQLSVEESLNVVLQREEARLYFVKALKSALQSPDQRISDAISALRWQVGDLSKTLDFRLGMLQKNRAQAWFRPCSAAELGPFPARINFSSLLPKINPEQSRKVRNELVQLWGSREIQGELLPRGDYLWSDLLELNGSWDRICRMEEPYQDLRLDELPEGLPDYIASHSLCFYLEKVNQLIKLARQDLDTCFQKFFRVTEAFLLNYYQKPTRNSFDTKSNHNKPHRRQIRSGALRTSLAFMKFDAPPTIKELKKRYFEMAKQYHPDATLGSPDQFQVLRSHYEKILQEVRVKPRN